MPSIKCDCRSRVPVTQLLSESGEPKPTTPLADVEGKLAAETDGQTSLLPASEMIDRELVTLALESHARALMYPNSRVQHDRANECHDELLRRLNTRASDAGKEAERSEEDAIIERDHLSDLIQHLDEAAGFDGEYKAVIGSHVVDEDFMCERITTVLKNASKEYVRGLNLFRQLVSGSNALRDLDVFACNGEHNVGCECFWEQCEAWAKQDAHSPGVKIK